jgi:hypothetical protein
VNATLSLTQSKIKIFFNTEWLRISILTGLVILAYYPFINGINMGAADAQWYQYILHDALIQIDHGLFPTYVGQSEFNFFGSSDMRAPYYLLFSQLIHILTFGQLNALYVQHLTILISAFMAAFLTYFLITRLAPKLRWSAVFLSYLYITCPGLIGIIYSCDMYHSFIVIPFIPLIIYGLIRSHENNDYIAYIITAIGLSLTWLAHPGIAVWITGICLLFYSMQLVFLRKGLIGMIFIPLLFILLNLWQFTAVYSMGLHEYGSDGGTNYITGVINYLKSDIPGVFLPIKWERSPTSITPFLQLGYSWWLIIFSGIILTLHKSTSSILRYLIACAMILILLLYPLPQLGYFLWSLVPNSFHNVTSWPMQRFYIILSGISCFIGILILKTLYPILSHLKKTVIVFALLLCVLWNTYESHYFIRVGQAAKRIDDSWSKPVNFFFYNNSLLPIHYNIPSGSLDPTLKNQILDKNQNVLPEYDNQHIIINKCISSLSTAANKTFTKLNVKFPIQFTNPQAQTILKLNAPVNQHYIFCFSTDTRTNGVIFNINGPHFSLYSYAPAQDSKSKLSHHNIIALPFYYSKNEELTLAINSMGNYTNTVETIHLNSYGFLNYDSNDLPIHIDSFTPYKARVTTKEDNTYLSIFKEYFPGYQASVNGTIVPVLQTRNKMIMIPLKNKGFNEIELKYIGIPIIKYTFYISSVAWGIITLYFMILVYRRFMTRKPSETKTQSDPLPVMLTLNKNNLAS